MILLSQTRAPATQVIRRIQAAYDRVKTLEENVRATAGKYGGTAHILFVRPGKLRVSGSGVMNSKYDLLTDGPSTWTFANGQWQRQQSPEMGIATITGISMNAGMAVPALLMHTTWGNPMLTPASYTVSTAKLNGRPLICLTAENPFPIKIFVDPNTYFLVKTSTTVMNQNIVVDFGPVKVDAPIPRSAFARK